MWELSLDRIRDEDPAGRQLLDICAYLAPEPIPLDLFTSHPDQLPQPLSAAAADPLLFNDAVATVVDYSMAKRSQSGAAAAPPRSGGSSNPPRQAGRLIP